MKIAVISNNDVHVFIRRNVFEIKSIIEIDVYQSPIQRYSMVFKKKSTYVWLWWHLPLISLGKNNVLILLNTLIHFESFKFGEVQLHSNSSLWNWMQLDFTEVTSEAEVQAELFSPHLNGWVQMCSNEQFRWLK